MGLEQAWKALRTRAHPTRPRRPARFRRHPLTIHGPPGALPPDHLAPPGVARLRSRRSRPPADTIARKIDQLRDAQRTGLLDPGWDAVDVALINQLASTRAGQPGIAAAAAKYATNTSADARRAALMTAVERLFPRTS